MSNMKDIPTTRSLDELSKYDHILRETCRIAINKENYDNIVNDTYLKIDKYYKKGMFVNSGYVFTIMKSINIDLIRATKRNVKLFDMMDIIIEEKDSHKILQEIYKVMDVVLDPFDKEFYLYLLNNIQRLTAEKYDMKLWRVKTKSKEIRLKLKPYLYKIKAKL